MIETILVIVGAYLLGCATGSYAAERRVKLRHQAFEAICRPPGKGKADG